MCAAAPSCELRRCDRQQSRARSLLVLPLHGTKTNATVAGAAIAAAAEDSNVHTHTVNEHDTQLLSCADQRLLSYRRSAPARKLRPLEN